jgi:hypothetical protein
VFRVPRASRAVGERRAGSRGYETGHRQWEYPSANPAFGTSRGAALMKPDSEKPHGADAKTISGRPASELRGAFAVGVAAIAAVALKAFVRSQRRAAAAERPVAAVSPKPTHDPAPPRPEPEATGTARGVPSFWEFGPENAGKH